MCGLLRKLLERCLEIWDCVHADKILDSRFSFDAAKHFTKNNSLQIPITNYKHHNIKFFMEG